jgi:hypothetical protein
MRSNNFVTAGYDVQIVGGFATPASNGRPPKEQKPEA